MVSRYHHTVFCFFYLEQQALEAKSSRPQGQEFQEKVYGTEERERGSLKLEKRK